MVGVRYTICHWATNRTDPQNLLSTTLDVPLQKPWSHILADLITKLPLAQGYNVILVVCDCFSKMAHFIAITEKTLVEELAKLF